MEKLIRNKKNLFIIIIVSILAFLVRLIFINKVSEDYTDFLFHWYDFIKLHGGFGAVKYNFADYTPPYLYIMAFCTYLKVSILKYLKFVSIMFDYIAAITASLIIKKKFQKPKYYIGAYAAILFLPTVVLNSSSWGQCDIIFTSFILLSLYMIYSEKFNLAAIFYAVAFAFKLQAIFIGPLYLVLLLYKKFKVRHIILAAAVYVLSVVPAVLLGGSFIKLLSVYLNQSSEYVALTKNAPNIYMFYGNGVNIKLATYLGIFITILLVLCLCIVQVHYVKKITFENIIELSFIFALVIPYFLPRMHDRYFFVADVLSIIYAFYFPKRKIAVLLVPLVSLFVYIQFLYQRRYIPFRILALVMLFTVIFVLAKYVQNILKTSANLQ